MKYPRGILFGGRLLHLAASSGVLWWDLNTSLEERVIFKKTAHEIPSKRAERRHQANAVINKTSTPSEMKYEKTKLPQLWVSGSWSKTAHVTTTSAIPQALTYSIFISQLYLLAWLERTTSVPLGEYNMATSFTSTQIQVFNTLT